MAELCNPGSYNDFTHARGLPVNEGNSFLAYSEALHVYREGLAKARGFADVEAMHVSPLQPFVVRGVGAAALEAMSEQDARQTQGMNNDSSQIGGTINTQFFVI